MKLSFYLEEESFKYNVQKDELLSKRLICLHEAKKRAKDFGDTLYRCDDIYNIEMFPDIPLCSVLYDGLGEITDDERAYLRDFINQCVTITDSESNEIRQIIRSQPKPDRPVAYMCLYQTVLDSLHVYDANGIIEAHRFYLYKVISEEDFLLEAEVCFPMLHFRSDVAQSLKTLSAPLNLYIFEVVRHLSALNDIFQNIFEENKHMGLNKVLELFSAEAQLAASLEGDLEKKKRLYFDFELPGNGMMRILCEPHTKLEGTKNAGDTKYRFDRIYFNQGSVDFKGKVLIAYIGQHL